MFFKRKCKHLPKSNVRYYGKYRWLCKCGKVFRRNEMDVVGKYWFDYFYKADKEK